MRFIISTKMLLLVIFLQKFFKGLLNDIPLTTIGINFDTPI